MVVLRNQLQNRHPRARPSGHRQPDQARRTGDKELDGQRSHRVQLLPAGLPPEAAGYRGAAASLIVGAVAGALPDQVVGGLDWRMIQAGFFCGGVALQPPEGTGACGASALAAGALPWVAVYHRRPDDARVLDASGADPWRPMMAGWSPGRLSLAGPDAGLFPVPAALSLNPWTWWDGTGLTCVAGISAAEAGQRLQATPPPTARSGRRGTARGPAERRCIRRHASSSVLVSGGGCRAAGGGVSAWRAAVAGCVPRCCRRAAGSRR